MSTKQVNIVFTKDDQGAYPDAQKFLTVANFDDQGDRIETNGVTVAKVNYTDLTPAEKTAFDAAMNAVISRTDTL